MSYESRLKHFKDNLQGDIAIIGVVLFTTIVSTINNFPMLTLKFAVGFLLGVWILNMYLYYMRKRNR